MSPVSETKMNRQKKKGLQPDDFSPADNCEACRRKIEELKKFKLITDRADYGVVIRDLDGNFVYVNKSFAQMHGYTVQELIGRHFSLCHTPEQLAHVKKLFKIREQTGSYFSEVGHKKRDGSTFPTLMTGTTIVDEEGALLYTTATAIDITQTKQTQKILQEKEAELKQKNLNLEEVNTALRVLLKRKDEDKQELEKKVFTNITELIEPYLERIKKTKLDQHQSAYFEILQSNLREITSSFSHTLNSTYQSLSPSEIKVANLVRNSKSTKEIAELLNVSTRTIEFHRDNIRKKIGIKNKKTNLRSYLLALQ